MNSSTRGNPKSICGHFKPIRMIGNLLCSSEFEYYRARGAIGFAIGSMYISFMISKRTSSVGDGVFAGLLGGIIGGVFIGNLPAISSLTWGNLLEISLFFIPLVGSIIGSRA